MLKLVHGRSYIWLFPVYLVLFFGCVALCVANGHENWGMLFLPVFAAFLLLCELWSGVALDSWWRATHLKGSWQYRAVLAWHTLFIAILSLISCLCCWEY